ncbi:hypothetical protein [Arthrobacter crystallopoietes]|uniref:DUF4232 domain-containing protein n=1 Tax=Crystallibacter crystallopoietes TaxID=37928 RepID=A0A1H1CFS3_9MICC|nr:hypothetical protein [Arthrobacter crystallopoietes]AUI50750.1 hypothetical protein AC20117_07860 [Arthrobacter crystallopoietes]SDQ63037.1 hypothetical protein SAMN04489742_1901 [Arthrobacter crystallopoietes]
MAGTGTGSSRGNGASATRNTPRSGRKPSPAVYRRRRLALLIAVLVVVGLLVAIGFWIASLFGGGSQPVADNDDGGSVPVISSPAASPSPMASAACDESKISVTASTDAPAYAAGENPTLVLEVANKGDSACEVNVGTDAMEFLVTSGEDRIFSSKDCAVDTSELMRTIEPGESERAQFTWERNRSAPGCKAVNANPQPGTYVLTAKLGPWTSDKIRFDLQ